MILEQQEVLDQLIRIVFLGIFPILLVVVLASLVSSVIQSAMAIKNESFDFASRILAITVALYFFLPAIITSVLELFSYAYRS